MDVRVHLGHDLDAHPDTAALAGIGLLYPGNGALGQHQVFPLGHDELSSLYVFDQRLYPDFELPAARRKYYQGWSIPG